MPLYHLLRSLLRLCVAFGIGGLFAGIWQSFSMVERMYMYNGIGTQRVDDGHEGIVAVDQDPTPLIFYHRPGKTGSTTIRIAMSQAMRAVGRRAAHCFNRVEWNEMGWKLILANVDFYGCHTRLTNHRYRDIQDRHHNVLFMTSTREASSIVLSTYLQRNRHRSIANISDPIAMAEELDRYRTFVDTEFPIDHLYGFHVPDGSPPLTSCPPTEHHVIAMRHAAERYDIVVDIVDQPQISEALVAHRTGGAIRPNFFGPPFNVRADPASPMIAALQRVDTTHRTCGNALVHEILSQQLDLLRDRLLEESCFDEVLGACDRSIE